MTTLDIVLAVMTARDLNATDKVMHETMRMRVGASLPGDAGPVVALSVGRVRVRPCCGGYLEAEPTSRCF